jgi:homoserine kinase
VLARVPASSANLGPGFDALGLALSRHVEVSVEVGPSFSITSSGEGAGRFDSPDHLGARVVHRVLGHWDFRLHVHSEIPLSRGLGSSAALAVAAAAAAGHGDPLLIGTEVDGHAENAAASVMGGLVVARTTDDEIVARPRPRDPVWRVVAAAPDEELSTEAARRVLPATVSFHDAVSNLGALGLLVAGLADHHLWHPTAMTDVLHQPYRMGLLRYAEELLAGLRDAGAAGACWSGAGSTMLALVNDATSSGVAGAARDLLEVRGVAGRVWELEVDRVGLVVS